ncbi:MAG: ATP-dependent DNA helicase RecG [Clostridiales Family XIII bacterium]|jgi:ATP-dependent DNA helicase RecG|nr:ATP-dependent DNA helicase RecG [Clostridiales Family XIII bacterium]
MQETRPQIREALIGPQASVRLVGGVGPKKAAVLEALGVRTVMDLLYNFPRTYEDRRNRVSVGELKDGVAAVFAAAVLSVSGKPAYYAKGKKTPLTVLVGDDTGAVEIVFFNSRYMDKIFVAGKRFLFFGTPQRNKGRLQLVHPDFENAAADGEYSGHGIMPIYALKSGLSQRDMQKWHEEALTAAAQVDEYLPERVVAGEKLRGISQALADIHFPEDKEALRQAKYRFVFEELLLLQAGLMRLKLGRESGQRGTAKAVDVTAEGFEKMLPFSFTGAQRRVVGEVFADMRSERAMNRLVQGDVGSGKTAVAAAAIYKAVKSGYQAVLMAPTEILAKQHYGDLSALFAGKLETALVTSGMTAASREDVLGRLASGGIDLAVGTHALIQPDVAFGNLGLVVTDEQHRFGVGQRVTLARKGTAPAAGRQALGTNPAPGTQTASGTNPADGANPALGTQTADAQAAGASYREAVPDILVMTATPIPRSLAFVLYGDLDMSVIDEMPPGRRKIATRSVTQGGRGEVYDFAAKEIEKGGQAYVVAPLIEDGEDGSVTAGLRSAESLLEELTARFPAHRVALLHGQMKQKEKDAVMSEFSAGGIDVLVSTVVIEVGVNVPNATLMVVENAERFGLAQLHQLRGRVGRGRAQSYCVLVLGSGSEDAVARARAMTETDDGFKIAEMDLSMRGPGEMFGVRQHGIPTLRIADLARHIRVAEKSKRTAKELLDSDPMLAKPENRAFGDKVESLFKDVAEVGL